MEELCNTFYYINWSAQKAFLPLRKTILYLHMWKITISLHVFEIANQFSTKKQ